MIQTLKIQNLILIETAVIDFTKGLNVITGESGAGKSALLSAIDLLMGQKADYAQIRNGEDLCAIEATFHTSNRKDIYLFLQQNGIISSEDSFLEIRRELHRTGKSKCFIQGQMVPLKVLQELSNYLIEKINQHHAYQLQNHQKQLEELDDFIDLGSMKETLREYFVAIKGIDIELEKLNLQYSENQKIEDAESLKMLQEANLQSGEEEEITQEHHILCHAQELYEKTKKIADQCDQCAMFHSAHQILQNLEKIDPKLFEPLQSIYDIQLQLDEVRHFFRSYLSRVQFDPHRLEQIESRLATLEHLKKHFQLSFSGLFEKEKELKKRLENAHTIEETREKLTAKRHTLLSKRMFIAKCLSEKRKNGALSLEKKVIQELNDLNMPNCQFQIAFSEKTLTETGYDQITFLFQPNLGGKLQPLSQYASGGEMSRVMLAIKCAFAQKRQQVTLIFDEIDANVGGETAKKIGQKLHLLSTTRQIFCVTHFVQVAKYCDTHFKVSKQEKESRAITLIQKLTNHAQKQEFSRMIGELPVKPGKN